MSVFNHEYKNIIIEPTNISYQSKKTNSKRFVLHRGQMVPSHLVHSETVDTIRYVVKTKIIEQKLPEFHMAQKMFEEAKNMADFFTRAHFIFSRNNFGSYLIDLPDSPGNNTAIQKFLTKIDGMITSPNHKETLCTP